MISLVAKEELPDQLVIEHKITGQDIECGTLKQRFSPFWYVSLC